ncbi:MAG: hypothetical protein ACO3O0_05720 [Bacteroidia bacterium]
MNRCSLLILLMFLGVFVLPGCYYDVEEELYGACDTLETSYTKTVKPILESNGCLSCHGGAATGSGGIILDSYASLQTTYLSDSIKRQRFITGSDRMPPSSAPNGLLSDCDMGKLKAWINAGFKEN